MEYHRIFTFGLLFLVFQVTVKAQGNGRSECSNDTMKKCNRNIEDIISGYGNNRRLEQEDQCWRVRQNFDCILWQTSMCLKQSEQEENSDIIQKGWRFLDGFCENFKNWWTKSCYRTEKLKRCENSLGTKTRSTDYESCRNYLRFRECATLAIETDCDSDDQRLLGVYLMDKGQQRSWKCPRNSGSYTRDNINAAPLSSNTREVNWRDQPINDSPSFQTCLYNTQLSTQRCLSKFENIQKEARDLVDEDAIEKKVCCGLVTYKNCVVSELKKNCGDEVSRAASQLVQSVKERTHYNCDKFDSDTAKCSGPMTATVAHAIIIGGFILSFFATFLL